MKRITCIIVSIAMVFFLNACSTTQGQKATAFVGNWTLIKGYTDVETLYLYSDGTCLVDNDETGKWSTSDGIFRVIGNYNGKFWNHDSLHAASYSIVDNYLYLYDVTVDGDFKSDLVFVKQQ